MLPGFDYKSQVHAAWMEHQILNHVKDALRVTLDWKVPSVGIQQKLSSVQFTLKSFLRHLERLMDIEEHDGYMALVAETKPNMHFRVERLERDHSDFRRAIEILLPNVESLNEFQNEEFLEACALIAELLNHVDRHDTDEVELLQEALLFDEGGEG